MNKIEKNKKNVITSHKGIVNFYAGHYDTLLKNHFEVKSCIIPKMELGFKKANDGESTFVFHSRQGREFTIKFDFPKKLPLKLVKAFAAVECLKNVQSVIMNDYYHNNIY
jgi:hypothetical protein